MSEVYLLRKNTNDPDSYDSTASVDFDLEEKFAVLSLHVPFGILRRLVKSPTRFLRIESAEIAELLRAIAKNESEPSEERSISKEILGLGGK